MNFCTYTCSYQEIPSSNLGQDFACPVGPMVRRLTTATFCHFWKSTSDLEKRFQYGETPYCHLLIENETHNVHKWVCRPAIKKDSVLSLSFIAREFGGR